MDAPQGRDEIEPVVKELRLLDHRLDIVWNPRALVVRLAARDVEGRLIPARYDGRWEVVIRNVAHGLHDDRDYSVLYQVRWDGAGKEAYRPVGMWLVEFMRKWDSTQSHFRDGVERMRREDEAQERRETEGDVAADAEALDRAHFVGVYAGGVGNWQGRGADFAEMARRATAPPNGAPALIPNARERERN